MNRDIVQMMMGGLFLIAFGTLGTINPFRIIYPFGGKRRQHSSAGIIFLRFAGVMVFINGLRFVMMGLHRALSMK